MSRSSGLGRGVAPARGTSHRRRRFDRLGCPRLGGTEPLDTLASHLTNNAAVQIPQELVERVVGLDSAVTVTEVLLEHLTAAFKLHGKHDASSDVSSRWGTGPHRRPCSLARDPPFQMTDSLIKTHDLFSLI